MDTKQIVKTNKNFQEDIKIRTFPDSNLMAIGIHANGDYLCTSLNQTTLKDLILSLQKFVI